MGYAKVIITGGAVFIGSNLVRILFSKAFDVASKTASEAYMRAFEQLNNLKFVIVRPFNTYSEFMREEITRYLKWKLKI